MYRMVLTIKMRMQNVIQECSRRCLAAKHAGIDGILVTVGLCIIALVLCVIMRDGLEGFIDTIVSDMTTKAQAM